MIHLPQARHYSRPVTFDVSFNLYTMGVSITDLALQNGKITQAVIPELSVGGHFSTFSLTIEGTGSTILPSQGWLSEFLEQNSEVT